MLFFAITIFSTGMGLVDIFVGNVERATPYDATFCANTYAVIPEEDMEASGLDPDGRDTYGAQEGRFNQYYMLAEQYGFSVQAYLESNVPDWDSLVKASAECDYYADRRRRHGGRNARRCRRGMEGRHSAGGRETRTSS